MAEDKASQLNLTVVALVALVAIVGLVALVMSASNAPVATGTKVVSASDDIAQATDDALIEQNIAGDFKKKKVPNFASETELRGSGGG